MNVVLSPSAWAQLVEWQTTDPEIFRRITMLIDDARRHPFTGLGKPEPLRGDFAGYWSRRITSEHRLVYRVRGTGDAQEIAIYQCRYHYR